MFFFSLLSPSLLSRARAHAAGEHKFQWEAATQRDLDDLPDCVAGDAVPCAAVRAAPPRCSKAAILREPGQEQTRVERSAASCKTSFLPAAAAGDEGIRRTEDGEEPVRQAPFQQLAAPVSAWSHGGRWRSRSDLEPRRPATSSAAGAAALCATPSEERSREREVHGWENRGRID